MKPISVECRNQFEKNARTYGYVLTRSGEDYKSVGTNTRWAIWKQAWAAREDEVGSLKGRLSIAEADARAVREISGIKS